MFPTRTPGQPRPLARGFARLFLVVAWFAGAFTAGASQSVTLAWDPSPDTNVAGYFVYYGPFSGARTTRLDAGTNTTQVVTGLVDLETNFFVVTAYDDEGLESDPSNEISFLSRPPVPGALTLPLVADGGAKISIAALLSSATEAVGDTLSLAGLGSPLNGGRVMTNAGWIYYSPPPAATNSDSFTYSINDGFLTVTGVVNLAAEADMAPSPNLSIQDLGDGSCLVRGDGIPGRTYRIQYRDTLPAAEWQELGAATANTFAVFELIDPATAAQRSYRSLYP